MKVFQEYEKFIAYAFTRPDPSKKQTLLQRYGINLKTIPIYCMTTFGWICLICFLLDEIQTLQEYSETIYALTTLASTTSALGIFEWQQKKLFGLIDTFEDIINARSVEKVSRVIYRETNAIIEKVHHIIFFGFTKITFPCITIPFIVYSYSLYFTTDSGASSFIVPFKAKLPGFDYRNPVGFIIFSMIEFYIIYYAMKYSAIFMCYPIGTCYLMSAFAEDIIQDTISLNELNKRKGREINVYKKLCSLIELHSTVQQVSPAFRELYQFPLTIYFVWCVSTIASTMLLLQIELSQDTPNISALVRLVCLQFWAYLSILLICELGDRVINRFSDIDICFLCNWHLFPANVRRVLPMVILNTQFTVALTGYGNIPCSRDTCKRISHGGFSYFMILRQFIK